MQFDILTVALAIFFLIIAYVLFDTYVNKSNKMQTSHQVVEKQTSPPPVAADDPIGTRNPGDGETKSEVIYTQDYYPWWRSTRWWNYDGWLYNRPYYNYFRRPQYYNYWYSGRPLIIGGKRYYRRKYW